MNDDFPRSVDSITNTFGTNVNVFVVIKGDSSFAAEVMSSPFMPSVRWLLDKRGEILWAFNNPGSPGVGVIDPRRNFGFAFPIPLCEPRLGGSCGPPSAPFADPHSIRYGVPTGRRRAGGGARGRHPAQLAL